MALLLCGIWWTSQINLDLLNNLPFVESILFHFSYLLHLSYPFFLSMAYFLLLMQKIVFIQIDQFQQFTGGDIPEWLDIQPLDSYTNALFELSQSAL